MTPTQKLLDEIHETSTQRWFLIAASVVAPVAACMVIALAAGRSQTTVTIFVALLAVASAGRPDTHLPTLTIVAVALFWLARIEDSTTAWSMAVAILLLTFHALTALMASTATGATLDPSILVRWLRRTAPVAGSAIALWALVVLLDRRHAAGSAVLTLAALVAVGAGALALRARSISND